MRNIKFNCKYKYQTGTGHLWPFCAHDKERNNYFIITYKKVPIAFQALNKDAFIYK